MIAIDGTKIATNVNRDRTMIYAQIARAIVEEAIETDAAETAQHGDSRGDELPELVASVARRPWSRTRPGWTSTASTTLTPWLHLSGHLGRLPDRALRDRIEALVGTLDDRRRRRIEFILRTSSA